MEICFTIHGRTICIYIPIYVIPLVWPPQPDPGPYRGMFQDATILAAVNEAAKNITEESVRHALQHGIAESIRGMQAKAGEDIKIHLAPHARH